MADRELREHREPLPKQVRWLRESSFFLFVSNLPDKISITELRAMFYQAGRIVDIFLPKDCSSGKTRGFASVRFASPMEADRAIEMAMGRSWGGQRIQVNMARFQANKMEGKGRKTKDQGAVKGPYCRAVVGDDSRSSWANRGGISEGAAGWIVEEGAEKGVRVALWVVAEEKKHLCYVA